MSQLDWLAQVIFVGDVEGGGEVCVFFPRVRGILTISMQS
jgi:hypothetical protein